MIKAVFLDYTGTMVRDDDPYTKALVGTFLTQSDLTNPADALGVVWGLIRSWEWEHYQDTFAGKDQMADDILAYCVEHYGLRADLDKMHETWRKAWIYAPLYDDVKPFVERCSRPVYVVTNDDLRYIELSLADKSLEVAGVISSEQVRANKPHTEILTEALRVAGVEAAEAVLIGDSETSDVACAQKVGIVPILLDRKGKAQRSDIQVARTLEELSF
ncbi:MAG: HAD family hydrolase [Coriobacteriales bacterium]|nr:HAD family hydrolase [Coriobacteriales bacterium]